MMQSPLTSAQKMSKNILPSLLLLGLLLWGAGAVVATPRIKVVKLAVTNPTDELRLHENIVVNNADLKRIAPDFRADDIIIPTSDAPTLEEDSRTIQTTELPSQ